MTSDLYLLKACDWLPGSPPCDCMLINYAPHLLLLFQEAVSMWNKMLYSTTCVNMS